MSPSRDPFEERFRTWASRPPGTSSAEAAARVRERLEARRQVPRWRSRPVALLAAAAFALVIAFLLIPATERSQVPNPPPIVGAELPAPARPVEVVVLVLEDSTPLYLSLPSVPTRPTGASNDSV